MIVTIATQGSNVALPFDGVSPDYEGISEPTLSILQSAFNNGDYTLLEEPEIVEPEPLPDWNKFIELMDGQGLFDIGYRAAFPVFSQLFNMVLRMRDAALPLTDNYVEWRNFKACYSIGVVVYEPVQLAQVELALLDANVPKFW